MGKIKIKKDRLLRPFRKYEPFPFLHRITLVLHGALRICFARGFLLPSEELFGFLNPRTVTSSTMMTSKQDEYSIFIAWGTSCIPMPELNRYF